VVSKEDRMSMYETLDELIRRKITVADFPPLEVVRVDCKLWCLSNRNVPMMHALFRFDDAPDA